MQVESALFFETAAEIWTRVYRSLRPRDAAAPSIQVTYCPFANANSFVRVVDGAVEVRITDLLRDAPAPITEALAHILLCKLFRRTVPAAYQQRYRLYLNRRDVRTNLHEVRRERGRKVLEPPRGQCYDLEGIFSDLNERFFGGMLRRPTLGWSRRPSRTLLGHYDASHDAIVLSRVLDDARVPAIAVEYVLFHEMLHLQHPVEHRGTRRCVHTPEFREAERAYPALAEAKRCLKHLLTA